MTTSSGSSAPPPRRVLVGTLCAVAVVAAACTGSDAGTGERLDAVIEQNEELGGGDILADMTPEQRQCIEETLDDGDISPVQVLTDASASGVEARIEMADIVIQCVPDLGEVDSYVADFTATFRSVLGPDADIDDAEGGCLVQFIIDTAEDPAEMLAAGTSDDASEVMFAGMQACFDGQSLAVVAGEAGSGPQAYGDDDDLDGLYDSCEAGDDRACDLLFFGVSEGSEYHDLAVDCAGRDDSGGYCTAGIIESDEGFADPTSPGLAALVADCEAGDMIACDTLFAIAPLGSAAEQIGITCGGKIAVGAVPNCRTRFGP